MSLAWRSKGGKSKDNLMLLFARDRAGREAEVPSSLREGMGVGGRQPSGRMGGGFRGKSRSWRGGKLWWLVSV